MQQLKPEIQTPALREALERGMALQQVQQETTGRELDSYMGRYGVVAPQHAQAQRGVHQRARENKTADLHANLSMQDLMQQFWQQRLDAYYESLKRQRKDDRRSAIGVGLGAAGQMAAGQFGQPQPQQSSTFINAWGGPGGVPLS